MLSNRLFRLLTVLGIFLVAGLVIGLIVAPIFSSGAELSFKGAVDTAILMGVVATFFVAVVNQLAWDFLDVGILDNFLGRFLKRVIFFGALVIALFLTLGNHFSSVVEGDIISQTMSLGAFGIAFMIAPVMAPVATTVLYSGVIVDDEDKEKGPFIPLIGYGVSLLAGLVLGFIGVEFLVAWGPVLLSLGALVYMFFYMKSDGFIYSEYSGGYSSSSSYSSGSSYSSSYSGKSSTSSYSGKSSSSYKSSSSSSSSASTDSRKNDGLFFNQLNMDLYRIARNYSTVKSIGYGASVNLDVSQSRAGNTIWFKINGRISGGAFHDQYEVNTARNNLNNEVQSIANDIVRDAENAVQEAREKYKDYDRNIKIQVKVESIR